MSVAKKIMEGEFLDFYLVSDTAAFEAPSFDARVSAGFPSPADDYTELKLDLNKALVLNPTATFYVRVKGMSMVDAGINEGDMLVVDRSLEAKNNAIAICVINGEFTVKRLTVDGKNLFLVPENSQYKAIKITEEMDFQVWGIVTFVIHKI
ncbi:MAG: translesion error-prone DNA polymerase V autoproteolytic subunit [Bacteroidales bacterium]|nr:translesion error-prone DNA polymerase V autoproteolytic subunit [Bacteroidales bacterium]